MEPTCIAKIIRRFAAAAAVSGRLPCDAFGTARQLEALSEALYATREFDKALNESSDLKLVTKTLAAKRSAAARFKREYGVAWPA